MFQVLSELLFVSSISMIQKCHFLVYHTLVSTTYNKCNEIIWVCASNCYPSSGMCNPMAAGSWAAGNVLSGPSLEKVAHPCPSWMPYSGNTCQ